MNIRWEIFNNDGKRSVKLSVGIVIGSSNVSINVEGSSRAECVEQAIEDATAILVQLNTIKQELNKF